jgi:hypothetical protein
MVKVDYITVLPDNEAPSITADPVGGDYTTAKQVVLSATDNSDPNPEIYYTTNGSDPTTNSTPYSGPINIGGTVVLKFIAVDACGNTSPIGWNPILFLIPYHQP